ncbi:uncharacterized protein LOC128965055 [Oppia nitens]|uniref:uncharacterized protein LOC128965055 n=1 Tax=Oppia nitens TaxID=1686743 RepID=UPI0023DC17A8|nr:uncharacterized protein LOC128965055 [Oppia nitens]
MTTNFRGLLATEGLSANILSISGQLASSFGSSRLSPWSSTVNILVVIIILTVAPVKTTSALVSDSIVANSWKSVQIFTVYDNNGLNIDNPKLVANWDEIDKIFADNPAVANNPLKLLVICGAPRIGKSTFASLLYLNNDPIYQNSDNNNNNNDLISIDNIVKIFNTSNEDFLANTKGVWITPVPIPVRERPDSDILYNVFIVDVEGILGPNSDQFIYQQLYVLSSMMSSHFIYYLRHPFNEYHEQVLQLYTTLAQTVQSLNDKLILMPSNLINENNFRYGRVDSDKYLDRLNRDAKINLGKFTKYFKKIECYLMPEPAEPMRTSMLDDQLTHYTMADIGQQYMKYVRDFRWQTMASGFDGLKTSTKGYRMRGLDFHQSLRPLFDLITSKRLSKIPNQMDMLSTDHYRNLVDKLVRKYADHQSTADCLFDVYNCLINGKQLDIRHQDLVQQLLTQFNKTDNPYELWSKSAIDDNSPNSFQYKYYDKLNGQLSAIYENGLIYRQCFNQYRTGMRQAIHGLFDSILTTGTTKVRDNQQQLRDVNDLLRKNAENIYTENVYKLNILDYNMADKLLATLDDYFEANEPIVSELLAQVDNYETQLMACMGEKSSVWSAILGRYNQWLAAHQEVFPAIQDQLDQRIRDQIARYSGVVDCPAIDYNQVFINITDKLLASQSTYGYYGDKLVDCLILAATGIVVSTTGPLLSIPCTLGFGIFAAIKYLYNDSYNWILNLIYTVDIQIKLLNRTNIEFYIFLLDIFVLIILTAEFSVRLWSCSVIPKYRRLKGRVRYLLHPYRLLDLLVIVISASVLHFHSKAQLLSIGLRGLKIFQIYESRLIFNVVWDQRVHLAITLYISLLTLLAMSFLFYFAERDVNQHIKSIPDAMWWSLITMSTVGYGDIVPQTPLGKCIASLCIVVGVSIYALPAGILGTGLALKVEKHQQHQALGKRRVPAARLIQNYWRRHVLEHRHRQQQQEQQHIPTVVQTSTKQLSYRVLNRQELIAYKFILWLRYLVARRRFIDTTGGTGTCTNTTGCRHGCGGEPNLLLHHDNDMNLEEQYLTGQHLLCQQLRELQSQFRTGIQETNRKINDIQ